MLTFYLHIGPIHGFTMCAKRLIFLFFFAAVHCDKLQHVNDPPSVSLQDMNDPPSVSLQDVNDPPSLSLRWLSKFTLGLTLLDGRQDDISLRHVESAGGVAVPCLYKGFMHRDNTGEVAVLGCSNWQKSQVTIVSNSTSGMFDIVGNNSTLQIENPYKANNTDEDIVDDYDFEGRVKRSIFPLDYEEYPFEFSGSDLDPVPADVIYEMDVAYEESFLERMGGNKAAAEQYILSVVAHTQLHLKHASLGTRVHLNILHKPKYLEGRRLKVHDSSFKSIQEAATIQNNDAPLAIFVAEDDSDRWMGVAYRRYGCDPSKARLILKHRCSVQKAAQTLGHEVLHLFGNFHDEEEDNRKKLGLEDPCSGTGLMSDKMDIAVRPEQWSICSAARLKRWYTNYGECLKPAPQCSDDSNSWSTPCLCGEGVEANLCGERHTCCEAATSTCLGVRNLDDVLIEMTRMKSQMMKLKQDVSLAKSQLSQQSVDMSLLQNKNTQQTEEIALIKNKNSQQTAEVSSLKSQISQQSEDMSLLQNKNTQQAAEITLIKNKNSQQTAEVSSLKSQISQQSGDVSLLINKNTQQTEEIALIKNKNSHQTAEVSSLKSQISQQSGDVSLLINKAKSQDTLNSQQSKEMSLLKSQNVKQSTDITSIKNDLLNLNKQVDLRHPQPLVCSSYSELSDGWRKIDYTNRRSYTVHCDHTGSGKRYTNLTPGWYRFTGAAGTKLPTSPAPGADITTGSGMICGTNAVGWISSGGHPTIQEGIVSRDVCWEYAHEDCWSNKKTTIKVAACRDWSGDYFVYELQPTPNCNIAYCTLD